MPAQTKTIQDLRNELKAKTKELAKLRQQRREAAAKLAAIDKQIASLAGRASKPGPKKKAAKKKGAKKKVAKKKAGKKTPARKAKRATGTPLLTYVQNVLAKASDGMRVKEVVGAVKKAGYKSLSKDFYGIVATTLRDKTFKRVKRGIYKLAK